MSMQQHKAKIVIGMCVLAILYFSVFGLAAALETPLNNGRLVINLIGVGISILFLRQFGKRIKQAKDKGKGK